MKTHRRVTGFKLLSLSVLLTLPSAYAANTSWISNIPGKIILGSSTAPSISNDGQVVAFLSNAGKLVGDNEIIQHIYIKNLSTNQISRASIGDGGQKANSISYSPDISGDGKHVVFYSLADNLVTADDNGESDVFIRNLETGYTKLVSTSTSGVQANGRSTEAVVSNDGRYIAFSSMATNLVSTPTLGKSNVYVKDMQTGAVQIISINNNGQAGDAESFEPAISASGRYVAFSSLANNMDSAPANNQYDIFVHDRELKKTTRVSINNSGQLSNNHSGQVSISDDGQVIAFASMANNLSSTDENSLIDVFVKDIANNNIIRITPKFGESNGPNFSPKVSGNGRFVSFYSSSTNLISDDTNNKDDLYLFDRFFDSIELVSLSASGKQIDSNIDKIAALNFNGRIAAFSTASAIDPADSNKQMDIFLREMDPAKNTTPVAKATRVAAQTCSNGGAFISLDGSESYDLDKDKLTYAWTGPFNTLYEKTTSTDLGVGTHTVSLKVSDPSGASSTDSMIVSVNDTVSPSVIAEPSVIIEATSIAGAKYSVNYNASDNCELSSILISPSPEYYPLGITNVTVTAIDSAGLMATDNTIIDVRDTTAPTIVAPANIVKEATDIKTSVALGTAITNDIFSTNLTNNAPPVFAVGNTIVKWTATDANGNSSSANQIVTISDSTKPLLTIPPDITLEATSINMNVDIGTASVDDIFPVTINNNAPVTFQLGNTNVNWTATDVNGNSTSKQQLISILDSTAPDLTVPANISIEATGISTAVDIGEAVASDLYEVNITNNAQDYYSLGNTVIIWTAVDKNGNSTISTQTVTVVDTTPPSLTIPSDLTVEANGIKSIVNIGSATASDIFQVTVSNNAPSKFNLGKTLITWEAVDENGNKTSHNQLVTVIDATAPELIAPGSITKESTGSLTSVMIGTATASDVFEYSISNDAPLSFPLGTTVVNWKVIDVNGNYTTATQDITIVDTTPPSVNAGGDITIEAVSVNGAPFSLNYSVNDICVCGELNTIITPRLTSYALGTTKITVSSTDISGNTGSDFMVLTVVDTSKPQLTIPGDMLIEATGTLTAINIGQAAANDIFPVSLTNNAPALFPLGTSTVSWIAEDANGNKTTKQQTITVVDTTAPNYELNIVKNDIWPPNHKMIFVASIENSSDFVDTNPNVEVIITSNGDHHRHSEHKDWKIINNDNSWDIWLRAEKLSHSKEERIYHVMVSVSDFSGNMTSEEFEVSVTHDRSYKHEHKANKHKANKHKGRENHKYKDSGKHKHNRYNKKKENREQKKHDD